MNEKEIKFIEIAIDIFSRYGVRKTTMGDIASQAGVSRQTLYATYANKEEILAAAIRYSYQMTIMKIREKFASGMSIGDCLDFYFDHAVVEYYKKMESMPDSDDLVTGFNAAGLAELKCAEAEKRELLVNEFRPYEANLKTREMTSEDLADFILTSSSNFKFTASSEEHLSRLIATLKGSVLALLGEK